MVVRNPQYIRFILGKYNIIKAGSDRAHFLGIQVNF